jgi:hypothetical protein
LEVLAFHAGFECFDDGGGVFVDGEVAVHDDTKSLQYGERVMYDGK